MRFGKNQEQRTTKRFLFAASLCAVCPLRAQCIAAKAGGGKVIQLHPREDLLQYARAVATTEAFKEHYRRRVTVEHSIARLVQRGIRQSRFMGRKRTLWQVALAAAVVNLIIVAGQERAKEDRESSLGLLLLLLTSLFLLRLAFRCRQRLRPIDFMFMLNRRPLEIYRQKSMGFRPSF